MVTNATDIIKKYFCIRYVDYRIQEKNGSFVLSEKKHKLSTSRLACMSILNFFVIMESSQKGSCDNEQMTYINTKHE
jgi:hypothetical protein